MPKETPSLEQRHVCQKTRVRSTKVMCTRSGSMVISHTTREKRSLASIVANSGHSRTKRYLLNNYLALNVAHYVLGVRETFKWPTHLTGTWPAVGMHGQPQQEAGTAPGNGSVIIKLLTTTIWSRVSTVASGPLQHCVLDAYLAVFHVVDHCTHLRKYNHTPNHGR
jgi:hypothetical protein